MSAITPDSPVNMKHRLTGAVVLVLVGVFILPMILNGHGVGGHGVGDSVDPANNSATLADAGLDTRLGSDGLLGQTAPRSKGEMREYVSHIHPQHKTMQPAPTTEPPAPTVEPPATPAAGLRLQPLDEQPATEGSDAIAKGWVVRIGSFAEKANAEQIVTLLRDNGLEPRTSVVQTGIGSVTRVWVGPFSERVAAARQRAHIQDVTGEQGAIKAYP